MRRKLTLSLSLIAAILLISSIISVMEYRSMSNYVSNLIADNVRSVNVAQQMSDVSSLYNLEILSCIGDSGNPDLPSIDKERFYSYCDMLDASGSAESLKSLTEKVKYAYSAYMLASMELSDVMNSDFVDTRSWYFDRLQPLFVKLKSSIDELSDVIYLDLKKNSETFERGFYRSIIPGIVAVGVGLLLIFLLMFFVMSYYVTPIYKMLDNLNNYRTLGRKYNYEFEGDDQLSELNSGISELIGENIQLKKRISVLRGARK